MTGAAGTAKDAVVGAKDRVVDATGAARERAAELSWRARERARYQTRQARVGFWETMEERPLALGAAALALGVMAGLMIPSTRKEDELMGETRDRLMERAKEVGEGYLLVTSKRLYLRSAGAFSPRKRWARSRISSGISAEGAKRSPGAPGSCTRKSGSPD